jgi:hypothetical protein
VLVDPSNGDHIVAGGESGCFESNNAASSFSACSLSIAEGTFSMYALNADPYRRRLFVAANGTAQGVFKNTLAGWNIEDTYDENINVFGFDGSNAQIVWGAGYSIFKSTTGGTNFQYVTSTQSNYVRAWVNDPFDANVVYMLDGNHLRVSTNRGVSFTGSYSWPGAQNGYAVAVDPTTAGRIYVATDQNLFRSVDSGKTYTSVLSIWPFQYRGVAVHPVTGTVLVTSLFNVYRSDNGGDSFTSVSDGLENLKMTSVSFDPTNPDVAYVGTTWRGLWKTQTGGK